MGSSLGRTGKEQEANDSGLKVIHHGESTTWTTCRHTSLSVDTCVGADQLIHGLRGLEKAGLPGNCRGVRTGKEHTRLCCWVLDSLLLVPAGTEILFWETGVRTPKTTVLRTGVNGRVQEESIQVWPGTGYHCTPLKAAECQETLCALHWYPAQRHQMRLGFWGKGAWLVWQWA